MRHSKLAAVATTLALTATAAVSVALAQSSAQPIIGLITKTETNPFFVKMKEGAQKEATRLGAKLLTGAGKADGDNAGQVTAIENMVAAGAKTILITPSDAKAIVPGDCQSPRRWRDGHRARQPHRTHQRCRRSVCHQQLPGGRPDRPVGQESDGQQDRRHCRA